MNIFSDIIFIVYKEPVKQPVEESVIADLLNRSLTVDISQPLGSSGSGEEYEVIGQTVLLPARPPCPRGAPLSQDQWDRCKDADGRVTNPDAVREIIFRGVCFRHIYFYHLFKFHS